MLSHQLRWHASVLAALLAVAQPLFGADKHDFLTANIDSSVRPGDDFFRYANGAWLKRNPIPPSESSWGVSSVVREELYATLRAIHEQSASTDASPGSDEQKIGDFWRMAMDVERARKLGTTPLRRELTQIDRAKNLAQVLDAAFEMQTLGVDPFFTLYVDQDVKESSLYSIYASQGGLGLPDRDFYLSKDKNLRDIRSAYVQYLARMLKLLGRNPASAEAAALRVMRFETALAEASRKLEDVRDPLENYHRIAPAELTRAHTPVVNWSERLATWKLQPDFVAVGQPEFFSAMDRTLQQTPIDVLKDYLRLRLVSAYAEFLSPAFDEAFFGFYKRVLSGQKTEKPRWKRVIDTEAGFGAVPEGIGMMVGRRYVAQSFPERTKRRYADMTRAIMDAYRERIEKLHWMTDTTKAKALAKLSAINAKIGAPDRWRDHSALAIGRTSYCENMMNISRWFFHESLARIGKPVDRSEWHMTPQTWNAYYSEANNEIVLPAAVFAIPGIADAHVDDAVVYAYGGASTIGHEITHGFDDQGRKFDAAGNLADWWTAEDAAAFERQAAAVVKQYNAYEPLPGLHINGKATLGENIADIGGLAIALDAFKKTEQYKSNVVIAGKTPLQRFFLGYALGWMHQRRPENERRLLLSDFHSPSKYRVLGPVSNFAEFYEAFGVTPGQKMWRDVSDRTTVW